MVKTRRRVKVRDFVKQCLDKGVTSPSEMRDEYNKLYAPSKPLASGAFTKAMRRMGLTAKDRLTLRHEAAKEKEVLDIEEYSEVKRYLGFSDFQQVGKKQKQKTLQELRQLWRLMGCTNPRIWSLDPEAPEDRNLLQCLKKNIGQEDNGQWKRPNKALQLLGAFNRTFLGCLPKGWSMGLKREAGELKDFFEFSEFDEFIINLIDTPDISKEGWEALFKTQVNTGCREGVTGQTGIISLKWEDINNTTTRCKLI